MLFNSFVFVLGFLPIVLIGFFSIARFSRDFAAAWLALASLAFYGWWDIRYVPLLVASILFNYTTGALIARKPGTPLARAWLIAGIAGNLGLLAYYKYSGFFLASVDDLFAADLSIPKVVLPLGISFFTFTQLAFLVDCWRGLATERGFVRYVLFVAYFPHLIAGPVIHHKQVMPQFAEAETYRPRLDLIALGAAIFTIGLAKKVIFADTYSGWAAPIFNAVHAGTAVDAAIAWTGALAYTLQIYMDFSGYSDMAVGLSLMIGVRLPWNFNSPYRSRDIIEFWRRWHMTLSSFLRDYLYVPLGGNRKGAVRRYLNLIITMVLGGLWHGASWTFVVWGGLHGAYLVVNHGLNALLGRLGGAPSGSVMARGLSTAITFVGVVVAWVFFRAKTVDDAMVMLAGMVGRSGTPHDGAAFMTTLSALLGYDEQPLRLIGWFVLGLGLCWFAPNTQRLADLGGDRVALHRFVVMGMSAVAIFLLLLVNSSRSAPEFIYFNF